MVQITPLAMSLSAGYWPSAALSGPDKIPNSAIDGSNVFFLGGGNVRSAKGLGTSAIVGGTRLYLVNSQIGATTGVGSIVPYTGGSYWWVSDNYIYINGNTLLPTGGALYYYTGSGTFQAGLIAPAAPTVVDAGAGNPGILVGDYAIKITRKRSFTTGESNPSASTGAFNVNGHKVTITFPAAGSGLGLHDYWGIYVTPAGQGSTNNFGFLMDVPSSMSSITLDWREGDVDFDLGPPTDHDPPPTSPNAPKFVIQMGQILILLGTFGGTFISPSVPGDAESYPFLYAQQLTPAEQIIGFARANEGQYFIWTANSVQCITYTGSPSAPVQITTLWGHTGIQGIHGACFAFNQFVGFNSVAGPVMMGPDGAIDTQFALPVRDKIRQLGWNAANVVVGHDPTRDIIVFAHGSIGFVYMRSLGIWSPPIDLSALGTVASAVTINGQLYLGNNAQQLFTWEQGSGVASWFIAPCWEDAGSDAHRKTIIGWRTSCNANNMSTKLFLDYSNSPSVTVNDVGSGQHLTKWSPRINKRCRVWQIQHFGTHGDEVIDTTTVHYIMPEPVREIS